MTQKVKKDLQPSQEIIEEESRKKGLDLNSKKIEVMDLSQKMSVYRSSLSAGINPNKGSNQVFGYFNSQAMDAATLKSY